MARHNRSMQAQASRQRQRIAADAARLMRESGIDDADSARRRAAHRLGVHDPRDMPMAEEVLAALRSEQQLFAGDELPGHLRRLREAAREALAFFSPFDPRLVGAVLDGSAGKHSAVCLHVFADDSVAVIHFLNEQGITHAQSTRTVRLDRERTIQAGTLEFSANAVPFELIVLPRSALRQAPLAPGSDAPMARASVSQLTALLNQAGLETGQP